MATTPQQALFLNVEKKEDTIAKQMAVAGKPTKNYTFDREINATTAAINTLRSLIALNASQITQIMGEAKVELGIIVTTPVDHINALVVPVELGISKKYVTFTFEDVFYVYAFVGEPAANYGAGTINKKVTDADLLKIWQSDVVDTGAGSPVSVSAMVKVSCSDPDSGGAYIYTMHNGLAPYSITYGVVRISAGVLKLWVECENPTLLGNIVFINTPQLNMDGTTGTIGTRKIDDGENRIALMLYGKALDPTLRDGIIQNYDVEVKCFVNPEGI